jgi:hypothetical protein
MSRIKGVQDNEAGFVTRRVVDVVFAQWHGPDWQP